MTCKECEQILLESDNDPACEDWIDVSVLNLLRTHAENCSACAAKMAETSKLNDGLDQLRLSDMQVESPASIESKLLVEFRRRTDLRPPITFRWRVVWAPAIALTLIAGLVFYSVRGARSPITVQTHIPRHRAYQLPSLPLHTSAGLDRTSIGNHKAGAERPQSTNLSRKPQTNQIRKPNNQVRPDALWPTRNELSLNGGGNVVRVTLSLSSLVVMGVPIYPEVSDRRVIADVTRDPFGAIISIHLVESKPSTN